jgi:DNA-binding LacI/PurR family transcriptional regulator
VLKELALPTVVIGAPEGAGGLSAVWTDDAAGARIVVEHLVQLGHHRIARVTGMPDLWHTRIRTEAFLAAAGEARIDAHCVTADYTAEGGADATTALLAGPHPPTAIVFDNDLMAVSGLGAALRVGVHVPRELSVVAWDDSVLCELVHPALTALTRDVKSYGAHAARRLLELAAGAAVGDRVEPPPTLTARASTARPPHERIRPIAG